MLATIPTRKESKVIKGNNTKIFNGRSLISWNIDDITDFRYIEFLYKNLG